MRLSHRGSFERHDYTCVRQIKPASMCKRAVERYNNEQKRLKQHSDSYTQGPLDEVFGQHSAFPIDSAARADADSEVYQYLATVRKEAENDRAFHFVENRTNKKGEIISKNSPQRTEIGVSILSQDYMAKIMDRLHSSKLKYERSSFISHYNISPDFIDFSHSVDFDDDTGAPNNGESLSVLEDSPRGSESIHDQTNISSAGSREQSTEAPYETKTREEQEKQIAPENIKIPHSAAEWRQLVFLTQPPPQEFFQEILEHPTIIKLIVYYTKWLSASVPDTLITWIFATFVRLDNALDHQELAIVRALGLKARKLRKKFSEAAAVGIEISEVAIWCMDTILVVVSEYYGQKDLLSATFQSEH